MQQAKGGKKVEQKCLNSINYPTPLECSKLVLGDL